MVEIKGKETNRKGVREEIEHFISILTNSEDCLFVCGLFIILFLSDRYGETHHLAQ